MTSAHSHSHRHDCSLARCRCPDAWVKRLGCECDDEVGASGGGEAFEDADGGQFRRLRGGNGGLARASSFGEFALKQVELEPAGPHGLFEFVGAL